MVPNDCPATYTVPMNLVTLLAFEDEVSAIQKEAGLKESLQKAYARTGGEAGILGEKALATIKKLPIVGKKVPKVGLGDLQEMAQRVLT